MLGRSADLSLTIITWLQTCARLNYMCRHMKLCYAGSYLALTGPIPKHRRFVPKQWTAKDKTDVVFTVGAALEWHCASHIRWWIRNWHGQTHSHASCYKLWHYPYWKKLILCKLIHQHGVPCIKCYICYEWHTHMLSLVEIGSGEYLLDATHLNGEWSLHWA